MLDPSLTPPASSRRRAVLTAPRHRRESSLHGQSTVLRIPALGSRQGWDLGSSSLSPQATSPR